jgi:DNA modification methylase
MTVISWCGLYTSDKCVKPEEPERVALDTIHTGDCRELGKRIPDRSVKLIFTDPPYVKDQMYLYDWLAEWSARVLTPDGFLMTYVGQFWKDDTMAKLRPWLEYFWDFTAIDRGQSPIHWGRRVIGKTKSVLCYRLKGSTALPRTNVLGAWVGGGEDKRYHTWQQDESTARYYMDCFSKENDLILDPFAGGGTIPYAAKQLKRKFIAFEIDPDCVAAATERLRCVQMPLFEAALHQQMDLPA